MKKKIYEFLQAGQPPEVVRMVLETVNRVDIELQLMVKNIPESKRRALEEFVDKVMSRYGSGIDEIILFGSVARGDFHDESDIDVLVIGEGVRTLDLVRVAHEVLLKYGEVIVPMLKTRNEYSKYSDYSFYRNIKEEGIAIVRNIKRV